MKTGVIGLPQVGKTSLLKILTRAKVETPAYSNFREAHIGIAKVPDELLGLFAFFTVGEDECRAWTIPVHSRAQEAAGAIHSDLEKHFIRAETIHWDTLLATGSEAAARAQGRLRLEGKDYRVEDGDVMHIRHSG
jgi:ribosome-binding ATPase YchF (GTP1/OBG family)